MSLEDELSSCDIETDDIEMDVINVRSKYSSTNTPDTEEQPPKLGQVVLMDINTGLPVCLVCVKSVNDDPINYVKPCQCAGLVHIRCIQKRKSEGYTGVCRICHLEYDYVVPKQIEKDLQKHDNRKFKHRNRNRNESRYSNDEDNSNFCEVLLIYIPLILITILVAGASSWKKYFNNERDNNVEVVWVNYLIMPVLHFGGYYLVKRHPNVIFKMGNLKTFREKVLSLVMYQSIWVMLLIIFHTVGMGVIDKFDKFEPRDATCAKGAWIITAVFLGLFLLVFFIGYCMKDCKFYFGSNNDVLDRENYLDRGFSV